MLLPIVRGSASPSLGLVLACFVLAVRSDLARFLDDGSHDVAETEERSGGPVALGGGKVLGKVDFMRELQWNEALQGRVFDELDGDIDGLVHTSQLLPHRTGAARGLVKRSERTDVLLPQLEASVAPTTGTHASHDPLGFLSGALERRGPKPVCADGEACKVSTDFGSTGIKLYVNGVGKCKKAGGTLWEPKPIEEPGCFANMLSENKDTECGATDFVTRLYAHVKTHPACAGAGDVVLEHVMATGGNRPKGVDNPTGWNVFTELVKASDFKTGEAFNPVTISGVTEGYFEAQNSNNGAGHIGVGGFSLQLSIPADKLSILSTPDYRQDTHYAGCSDGDKEGKCGAGKPEHFYELYDGMHIFSFVGQLDRFYDPKSRYSQNADGRWTKTGCDQHIVGGMASSLVAFNKCCFADMKKKTTVHGGLLTQMNKKKGDLYDKRGAYMVGLMSECLNKDNMFQAYSSLWVTAKWKGPWTPQAQSNWLNAFNRAAAKVDQDALMDAVRKRKQRDGQSAEEQDSLEDVFSSIVLEVVDTKHEMETLHERQNAIVDESCFADGKFMEGRADHQGADVFNVRTHPKNSFGCFSQLFVLAFIYPILTGGDDVQTLDNDAKKLNRADLFLKSGALVTISDQAAGNWNKVDAVAKLIVDKRKAASTDLVRPQSAWWGGMLHADDAAIGNNDAANDQEQRQRETKFWAEKVADGVRSKPSTGKGWMEAFLDETSHSKCLKRLEKDGVLAAGNQQMMREHGG